jgi:hypothetical protein
MPTQKTLAEINSEYAEKIKAAVESEIDSLKDLLKQVANIHANIQEAKADVDLWSNKTIAKLLASIGLAPVGGETPKAIKLIKTGKRLRGDKKQAIKTLIFAIIKASRTGVKRGELQTNAGIQKYCQNLGIAAVPNLAPVLKEMIKERTIIREGDKATAVYKAK